MSAGQGEAADRPAFCIVDPSLRDFVGHHFAYDNAVASAAEQAGFRAVILAHNAVSAAIGGNTAVVRCFRRDIWADTEWTRHLPGPVRTAATILLANRDFRTDLTTGLCGFAVPRGSILFAHMIFRNQLPALARFVSDQPPRGPMRIILLLRYQPDFYDNPICHRAFRRLERAASTGRDVRLATDSERLSRELGCLTSLPIEVMPIPLDTGQTMVPPSRPSGAALRFVSLGNARDEKGFIEILDAISLLRDSGELDGLEFVLQSNDAAPDVQAAIDRFSASCPPNVTLWRHSLAPADYDALLRGADVVLAPYWRDIYRSRTSGIVLESIAAGKIVVTTRDTWMSDQLERHGAGVLVSDRDPTAIAAAIRTIRTDRAELAARASSGRSACLARHSAAALVRQAVADGTPDKAVSRVAVLYPWGDFLERRSGASLRCGLLVQKLAPLVGEIRVLETGVRPTDLTRGKYHRRLRTLRYILLDLLLARPAFRERNNRAHTKYFGNVTVEQAPPRLRAHLARWLFRLPFLVSRRDYRGQELIPWYFLERWLDPLFGDQVKRLAAWADVVLLEYPFWAGIVAPACEARSTTLIITAHDILSRQVTAGSWLHRLAAKLEHDGLARADHVVCVSEADREAFAAAGITAHVIPNPVDPDRIMPAAAADPRAVLSGSYGVTLPSGPACLFVGSLFGPNVDAVARIKEIAARMPGTGGAVFVIAGSCAEPAHGDNWIAMGSVEAGVLALLYGLSAIVLVPLREGTGSSVKTVEAMAAGKLVLGTGVAFRGLNIRPGTDCVLEDDFERWPSLISELLMAPDRLAALGGAARLAGEAYDYRRVFDAYLPLIGLRA